MSESSRNNSQSISELRDAIDKLRSKSADFPGFQKELDEVNTLMGKLEDKKFSSKDKSNEEFYKKMKTLITTTTDNIENFKSNEYLKILKGFLEIASSLADLVYPGQPFSLIFWSLSKAVGVLITESKPNQPSLLHQLTNVVRSEMIHFNNRLQDQKYNGLQHRSSEQIFQLQQMKKGEKLDDPTLWNDYVQFLGELANRFESPLPFKYENKPTEDPNVKDFVTAIVKYSEAHSCFITLLFIAKAKFAELGNAHKVDIATVDRKMIFQIKEAREKLSFLSEKRFLTFLGRIKGGKLTKIVALSRRIRGKSLVETVRHSLGLSPMPDLSTVESSAKKVSQQAVTLRSAKKCNRFPLTYFAIQYSTQFINDADIPIKIVSGEVGQNRGNQFQFERNLPPRSSHHQKTFFGFSTGGYIVLYLNGNMLGSDSENTRVIEFAVSTIFDGKSILNKIGMTDETDAEFLRGQNAYDKRSADNVTLYFSENERYFIAKAEIFFCWPNRTFQFIIQDFDPEAVGDEDH